MTEQDDLQRAEEEMAQEQRTSVVEEIVLDRIRALLTERGAPPGMMTEEALTNGLMTLEHLETAQTAQHVTEADIDAALAQRDQS